MRLLGEQDERVCERAAVSGCKKEASTIVLQYLYRSFYCGRGDRHAVQHSFEDNYSKGLISAWDDKNVCPVIPAG
jgi:hypothetical protein